MEYKESSILSFLQSQGTLVLVHLPKTVVLNESIGTFLTLFAHFRSQLNALNAFGVKLPSQLSIPSINTQLLHSNTIWGCACFVQLQNTINLSLVVACVAFLGMVSNTRAIVAGILSRKVYVSLVMLPSGFWEHVPFFTMPNLESSSSTAPFFTDPSISLKVESATNTLPGKVESIIEAPKDVESMVIAPPTMELVAEEPTEETTVHVPQVVEKPTKVEVPVEEPATTKTVEEAKTEVEEEPRTKTTQDKEGLKAVEEETPVKVTIEAILKNTSLKTEEETLVIEEVKKVVEEDK
ncbi:hypothetical protein OSB04_017304 [Centaurea solstitialis]|uniref:Uncharacterized protein n=1 Tax=Centaurea solstitialis TaxID=347529 RepID=A0AA38T2N6_9ASTR|nr:hypothetical protein OSB04_017304 [Centaurea solstitialis]